MTSSVTNNPRSETTVARRKRTRIRALIAAAVVLLIGIFFAIKPPFVVRPLPGREGAAGGAGSQPTESAAAKFVDGIWDKLGPVFDDKAQDIAKVLPEIRTNPDAAGEKYGRREATNPYNYMVKGTGKVAEINTESVAGTAILEIPGLDEKVALQIGPVVRGTALRDATGLVSFNQFANQLDYADVSKELNSRALKAAFSAAPAASLAGKTVTFYGAFTFDPHSKSPVLITPVKISL
jgi:predicted lipoprotein